MTLSLVQTVTVGSGGAASIEFTGIPQTGTDLLLVASLRCVSNASAIRVRLNGDSASNYSYRFLQGTGAAASSGSSASASDMWIGRTSGSSNAANTFGNTATYFPNYASSAPKSASSDSVYEDNATAAYQLAVAGGWVGAVAITSISLTAANGSLLDQYSTASLYTITKGSGGATVS